MVDDLHPNVEELQEELRELFLLEKTELDLFNAVWLLESNRPRGILSTTDREYLLGQKEYEHPQSEANRKQDIRERVINAFQDFLILTLMLSAKERKKIFNDEISEKLLQYSLESMVSFVYLGLEEDIKELEKIIEMGVYSGANLSKISHWSGEVVDVDTLIDLERRPDRSEVIQKLEQGKTDQLTPAEIGILVRSGKLDESDLDKLENTSTPYPFGFDNSEQREE